MTTIAKFSIEYTQFINENVEIVKKLPKFVQNLQLLKKIYETMVLVRLFDEKAVKLQRTGQLGTYAGHLGNEGFSVGYGSAMQTQDLLIPYYRDYGAQIWRGVSLLNLLHFWGGNEIGNNFENCRYDFPIAIPIASQTLHAIGVAKAFQYRKQTRVVVTSIGDGGTSEGDFYEAINAAGVWQLPIVFIINNNQWAISVPLSKQTNCKTLAQKAIAAGIPSEQVDGNDVIAMHAVCAKAIEYARSGQGPYLIEAITYRLCDHTTADDATRYRSTEEVEKAWKNEPIKRLYDFMLAQNIWDEQQQKQLLEKCHAKITQAVTDYQSTPKPQPQEMFDHMYAKLPKLLLKQRQQAMAREND